MYLYNSYISTHEHKIPLSDKYLYISAFIQKEEFLQYLYLIFVISHHFLVLHNYINNLSPLIAIFWNRNSISPCFWAARQGALWPLYKSSPALSAIHSELSESTDSSQKEHPGLDSPLPPFVVLENWTPQPLTMLRSLSIITLHSPSLPINF